MKQLFFLLAITAGILFFQPTFAQDTDSAQQQSEQAIQQESSAGNSVILL